MRNAFFLITVLTAGLMAHPVSATRMPDDAAIEALCRARYAGRSGRIDYFLPPGGFSSSAGRPTSAPKRYAPPRSETTRHRRNGGPPARSPRPAAEPSLERQGYPVTSRERYPDAEPNKVKLVSERPVSTFSVDVDTSSYALVRRNLQNRRWPAAGSVRVEELINYFDYAYPEPADIRAGFRPTVHLYPAPWDQQLTVMQIGLKAYDIPVEQRPAANLVFLLDVSGSMNAQNKLPLAKQAMCLLAHKLNPTDHVSMVVYAGASGVVLEPTAGDQTEKVLAAMDRLAAGGSTHGSQGIQLAYAMAERHAKPGMANRVILVTDGDFNVGLYNQQDLITLVDRKRKSGVFLTVLGVGQGNYNDVTMQALAQNGNGVAAYIDSFDEARKVLTRSLTQALVTVAKDVKLQVEFNPAKVAEYRLIGYETRALNRADFADDKVDAGETGSGHTVTALYELALVDSAGRRIAPSRYAESPKAIKNSPADEFAFLRIRFKTPDTEVSRLIERPITEADQVLRIEDAPEDARFAAAVAWFAQRLRWDPIAADWTALKKLSLGAIGDDPHGDRLNFVTLVDAAKRLDH